MFEDPKLFRQARTLLEVSKREIAEIAGEKESSVADAEAGRKKLRPELAFKLWAALWKVVGEKKQRFTKEQMEKHENLLDMMLCAHDGLALDISPDKLLAWFRGEKDAITPEEEERYRSYAGRDKIHSEPQKHVPHEEAEEDTYRVVPLTFLEAERMPVDEVMDIVFDEIESSQFFALQQLANKSITPEQQREDIKAQVRFDPRVKIAGAKAWIAAVEKQRDEAKRELQEVRQELLDANQELLEAYRRIVELEKDLTAERQRK